VSGFVVRRAIAQDAATLVELAALLTREDTGAASRLRSRDLLEHCFGERPLFEALVGEEEGRLLGYASFYPAYDTQYAAKGFYLQDLYVRREARRRGVGRALMAAVARACLDAGGSYMSWHAQPSNRAGRAFYRALGARSEPVSTLSLQPGPLRRLADTLPET
jgi:ribosomal protein S18 acetylase RimI-like enzyme